MRWQNAVIIPLFYFLGDADIVLADAGTGQILNKVHVNQKVRKLFFISKMFCTKLYIYDWVINQNSNTVIPMTR